MEIIETELPGVLIIEPDIFEDKRGFFMETWNQARYEQAGLKVSFVQDNLSYSAENVVRGLHFQNPKAQGKLVYVLQGEVFDVAVDIRVGSPSFGKWVGVTLSGENKKQFYIPEGFAHGFCVTRGPALFTYKCTDLYSPPTEGGVIWNDPHIGIEWPVKTPILSDKDQKYKTLQELPAGYLPVYGAFL